jgi:hypothetical protein
MITVTVARKPSKGTLPGSFNIDASRVVGPKGPGGWGFSNKTCNTDRKFTHSETMLEFRTRPHEGGRFPANLILCQSIVDSFNLLFRSHLAGNKKPVIEKYKTWHTHNIQKIDHNPNYYKDDPKEVQFTISKFFKVVEE